MKTCVFLLLLVAASSSDVNDVPNIARPVGVGQPPDPDPTSSAAKFWGNILHSVNGLATSVDESVELGRDLGANIGESFGRVGVAVSDTTVGGAAGVLRLAGATTTALGAGLERTGSKAQGLLDHIPVVGKVSGTLVGSALNIGGAAARGAGTTAGALATATEDIGFSLSSGFTKSVASVTNQLRPHRKHHPVESTSQNVSQVTPGETQNYTQWACEIMSKYPMVVQHPTSGSAKAGSITPLRQLQQNIETMLRKRFTVLVIWTGLLLRFAKGFLLRKPVLLWVILSISQALGTLTLGKPRSPTGSAQRRELVSDDNDHNASQHQHGDAMTWLTPALEALWSEGCGRLLEAALREEVERTLGELEKTSEYPVYVSVRRLQLGQKPPTLKALGTRHVDPGLLELEAHLEWYPSSDLQLVFEFRPSRIKHSILPHLILRVHDVAIDAEVRVIVEVNPLSTTSPIGRGAVTLKSYPTINFAVSPISTGRIDIANLPGLRKLVDTEVRRLLSCYVTPNAFGLDLNNTTQQTQQQ